MIMLEVLWVRSLGDLNVKNLKLQFPHSDFTDSTL